MHETENFEHAGFTIRIGLEEHDTEHANPRDCDELGTMVCWHPDYDLGDEQIAANGSSTLFQTESGRSDFRSMEQIERYLTLMRKAVVVMPLYLLDHSGISISVGANTVGRGDTAIPGGGHDSWGNARGWDTTMVGFIYTTAERIEELCGKPRRKRDEFYCPPDWQDDSRAWIVKQLRNEVRYYDAYLQGSVYYYVIENDEGDVIGSCGCYLVAGEDDLADVRSEAKSETDAHVRWTAEQEVKITRCMAL